MKRWIYEDGRGQNSAAAPEALRARRVILVPPNPSAHTEKKGAPVVNLSTNNANMAMNRSAALLSSPSACASPGDPFFKFYCFKRHSFFSPPRRLSQPCPHSSTLHSVFLFLNKILLPFFRLLYGVIHFPRTHSKLFLLFFLLRFIHFGNSDD